MSYNVGLQPAAKWSKTKSVVIFSFGHFLTSIHLFKVVVSLSLFLHALEKAPFECCFAGYSIFHEELTISLLPDLHVIRMWETCDTPTHFSALRQDGKPTELLEHLCWKLTKHQGSGKRKAVLNSNLFPTDKPKLRLQDKTLNPPPVASSISSHSNGWDRDTEQTAWGEHCVGLLCWEFEAAWSEGRGTSLVFTGQLRCE